MTRPPLHPPSQPRRVGEPDASRDTRAPGLDGLAGHSRGARLVAVTATSEMIRGAPRVRVNEAYVTAMIDAGLIPLVIPPGMDADAASRVLDSVDGLLLTGGEDVDPREFGEAPHPATQPAHAARDATELALARAARARGLPTLAICRGAQVMNVALGGTLVQDIPAQRPDAIDHDPDGPRDSRVHPVFVDANSRLRTIVQATEITTNSFHHQAIDKVGRDLRTVAVTKDDIVEAIESTDSEWWMVAVQWHPEELTKTPEPWDRALFAAFANAVRSETIDSGH